MRYSKYIFRDLSRSRSQAVVFVLCVVLAIVTLVAVNGFSGSVTSALMKDARTLHVGDIIVQSRLPLSKGLQDTIEKLKHDGKIQYSQTYEFYSVVQAAGGDVTLLSNIKAVTPQYPLYGRCELESGQPLSSALVPGTAIVDRILLERMGLHSGDRLVVGRARLTIVDVVVREPDRPVTAFALGPRIFVSAADLDAIDLIQKGSRVRYGVQIKTVAEKDLQLLFETLVASADPVLERVDTYLTARSGVKRFFDNFIDFLNLVGIFTLLLAGYPLAVPD